MKAIKWFTQRVTLFIVLPTVLLVIPFVLAKVGQVIGLWTFIDKLYPITVLFAVCLVMTRWAFMFGWYKLAEQFIKWGTLQGFFWFKHERGYYHPDDSDSVDKSGAVMMWTVVFFIAFIIAEFVIRITIRSYPFYLPPMN